MLFIPDLFRYATMTWPSESNTWCAFYISRLNYSFQLEFGFLNDPLIFFSFIGRDPFRGRSCSTRHCNKGCQTIMLASALNISYYFSVLSLGLYLNYTHVSYFTVVSPITCVMRSRRIQRRTIRIIFPFLSTAVRWEKQGFQHFMIGERNCHMIF